MLFFLDENFPLRAMEELQGDGHTVFRSLEFFRHGVSDEALFEKANELGAVFLTTDKDFFHTVPFLYPERKISVVSITLDQPTGATVLRRLRDLLESIGEPKAPDVYLVTDRRILRKR